MALALLMAACSSQPTPTPGLSQFAANGISFAYPANWNAAHYDVASSHIQEIVFLSTDALSDPCQSTANQISCGNPVGVLSEDGVLVNWSHEDFLGWSLDTASGSLAQVGGRRAKIDWTAAVDDSCAQLGGGGGLVANIEIPAAPDNWMQMWSCVRGPNFEALHAQLAAMLASVAWTN